MTSPAAGETLLLPQPSRHISSSRAGRTALPADLLSQSAARLRFLGLSWVAVWTLLFTVVVPTPPRRAVVAALASVSSVPVIVALAMTSVPSFRPGPAVFFFWFVFPYLLVVIMADVGARVVYGL